MPLLIPQNQDYQNSVDELQNFFDDFKERVSWVIYGSFTNGKLRGGLSDIDIFTVAQSENIAFPLDISMAFSQVKSSIESLGITLQVNMLTTQMLGNSFTSPDFGYLLEVSKGIERGYSSSGFSEKFIKYRSEIQDDLNMARFFLRKVNNLGISLGDIIPIVLKEKKDISIQDQKKLCSLWDNFKKMLSLITVAIRIVEKESLFAEADKYIIDRFQEKYQTYVNASGYVQLMNNIQNIEDWYEYLKLGGVNEISELYNSTFIPFLNALGDKLGKYNKEL